MVVRSKKRNGRLEDAKTVLVSALALLCFLALLHSAALAQDDADMPLGDVARMMRKKPAPAQDVIDNDNLPKVMQQAEIHRASDASLRFSMEGEQKSFKVSSPDVTCSLSFTANAKALLSRQYEQFELPASEIAKLSGPASVEGDTLQISLFNGTDWHVSELAVAVTVVKRTDTPEPSSFLYSGQPSLSPEVRVALVGDAQIRKKSDQALLYRMRQAAPPASVTVFSIPLNFEIAPDQEWHWAIVQARGYPPAPSSQQTAAAAPNPAPVPAEPMPVPQNSVVIPASLSQPPAQ
jgi:hypothetical protein